MNSVIKQHPLYKLSKISIIDLKVVSTDSNKIGNIAKKYGLSFLFKRPKQLAKDRVSDYEAIKHALLEVEKITNQNFKVLWTLAMKYSLMMNDYSLSIIT